MNVLNRLRKLADTYPWFARGPMPDERSWRISRWLNRDTREDLVVIFDRAGRVECYSVWHTTRVMRPDYENGKRVRLEAHLNVAIEEAAVKQGRTR